MISYLKGDLLKDKSQVLVNPVNCVGISGKGLALQFKNEFPSNFSLYQDACDLGKVVLGKIFVYQTGLTNPQFIFNFPTKQHWKDFSHLTDISLGLKDLENKINEFQIKSIAIPPLGCGLGGLNWKVVKVLIKETCSKFPNVDFKIYGENNENLSN